MLELNGLSTEAKIGKILILISIILSVIGIVIIVAVSLFLNAIAAAPYFVLLILAIVAILKGTGLIIGIFAFKASDEGLLSKAGVLAVISSILPPLDIIMFIGGILCIASPEAQQKRE